MTSLTRYYTDPEHLAETLQRLHERVVELERQIRLIRDDQRKDEVYPRVGGERGV
jgi:hypothetical protein